MPGHSEFTQIMIDDVFKEAVIDELLDQVGNVTEEERRLVKERISNPWDAAILLKIMRFAAKTSR